MASAEGKQNKTSTATSPVSEWMREGFQAIVQAHNDWLMLVEQQQTMFLQAVRDGLDQYEALYKQGETEYRKAVDGMTEQAAAAVQRAASYTA